MVNNSNETSNANNNNNNNNSNNEMMVMPKAYVDDAETDVGKKDQQVLQAFVHQVSGRAHMLKYNAGTICKSLSVREWKFYCGASPRLLEFTPAVKGILFVQLDEDRHHFRSVGLVVPRECSKLQQEEKEHKFRAHVINEERVSSNQLPICKHTDSEKDDVKSSCYEKMLFKGLERLEYEQNSNFTKHPWTVDKDQEAVTEAVGKNPWSLRQHRREMDRMLKGEHIRAQVDLNELLCDLHEDQEHDTWEELKEKVAEGGGYLNKAYLMLEDVTAGFHFPTILDLKVGTQLDRLDCSQMKRDKHFNLVQRSSTGSLRLRLAGMQVYQVTTRQYLCRDKYYGRGLCKEGFKSIIEQFLHNGERLLMELVPTLVERLRQLKQVLTDLNSYRFYASSVLIAYEGDPALMTDKSIHVYMIDFAHSTYEGFMNDPVAYGGIDGDCVYALESLINVLTDLELKQTASPNLSSDESSSA